MYSKDSILSLKGIGEKTASYFNKMGITEVGQLLHYYPRDYDLMEDAVRISELEEGRRFVVQAGVIGNVSERKAGKLTITTFQAADHTGIIQITYFNMPFIKKVMKKGAVFFFRGKAIARGSIYVMEQPAYFTKAQYEEKRGVLTPVYPLTAGLTQNVVQKAISQVLNNLSLKEHLPLEILSGCQLMDYENAMHGIHFPSGKEELIQARKRLVFEEFLAFLCQVRSMKESVNAIPNAFPMIKVANTERFLEKLPFRMTEDQKNTWDQVSEDLSGEYTMNRLIQGDVGSGKTLIAFLALLMTAANGYQGAFMAPTEVLATQHYNTFLEYAGKYDLPIRPVLLTGSLTAKGKQEIYEKILAGKYNVIIGTHALFQEKVEYKNLALVITDEQHRFGVHQREHLMYKGGSPHVMVMSATPIPRTLAMILYGDLNISVIKQMPEGRIPIKNCVVGVSYREKAYQFFAKEIQNGHQVFVICPMIEPTEGSDLENVEEYTEKLRHFFPDSVQISSLHGKMKAPEKQRIMDAFASGKIDILVSTTVIEVGVNVPNATVMMIENAERFGLAQLHQLRGRVGRGKFPSYCIFLDTVHSDKSAQRLDVLNHSNDGFYIAEQDLKLRGPGDLFGIRQSGDLCFQLADIYQDSALLLEADKVCQDMQKNNITLTFEESKSKLVGSGFLHIM